MGRLPVQLAVPGHLPLVLEVQGSKVRLRRVLGLCREVGVAAMREIAGKRKNEDNSFWKCILNDSKKYEKAMG